MNNPVQELLKDKEYCIDELHRISNSFNMKELTEQKARAARRTLVMMLAYAPEELNTIIYAHIHDLEIRCAFLKFI